MDNLETIRKERTTGRVLGGTVAGRAKSAAELAASFGLSADPACYRTVDAELARAIVVGILHRDLAYGTRLMSLAKAEELAGAFIDRYAKAGASLYTNAEFKRDAGAGLVMTRWNPATSATFDTGVLIIAAPESACVWIAEED
jgi:hypothetical protein